MKKENGATTTTVAKINNIETVLHDTVRSTEDGHIFVKPVCDFFGISYIHQKRKIAEDPICQSGSTKKYCQSTFGDKRLRLCVNKRAFIRWIQIISVQIVHKNLQDLFTQYQVAVFDYLYEGTVAKTTQLEDIRTYAININNALQIRNQIMEYVGEQKNHRNLCLATPPEHWVNIRTTLTQTKELPGGTDNLKAIGPGLPNNIDELKKLKKHLQTNITKHKHRLLYQSPNAQENENPIPEGYKREIKKLQIQKMKNEVEQINLKIIEAHEALTNNKMEG